MFTVFRFFKDDKTALLISIVTGKTTAMVLEISTANFGSVKYFYKRNVFCTTTLL